MIKLLKNPFYIYILAFAFTFLVYTLDWSNIYPDITLEVKIFFSIAFLVSLFFGVLIQGLKLIKKTPALTKFKLLSRSVYLIFTLYFIEFLFIQEIPLFSANPALSYKLFGIPLLHGILISFNSFMIAHTFAVYMSSKSKKVLRYNLILYIPAFLIINRSIIVFGLLTSVFIYIHFIGKVKRKTQVWLVVLSLIGLFFFGVIGNLRTGEEYLYTQTKASSDFMESSIPKEYYWTYLYVASPLANFQNTVNNKEIKDYDFTGYVFYENIPKIISKNFGYRLGIEKRDMERIVSWLTVGTTYAKSYSYLGWNGPYLLFFSSLAVYLLIFFMVPRKSNYHITTITILSVIIFLNLFTNMLIVTGISFQLAYCIIFAFFERKVFVYKT